VTALVKPLNDGTLTDTMKRLPAQIVCWPGWG
jgi:hypothetical protein